MARLARSADRHPPSSQNVGSDLASRDRTEATLLVAGYAGRCELRYASEHAGEPKHRQGHREFEPLLPSARPIHALERCDVHIPARPVERPLWRQRMARVGCPSTTVVGPNETFAMPALRWMFGQLGQLDAAVVGSGTGLEGPVRVHAFADRRPRPHHASQPLALVVSRRP